MTSRSSRKAAPRFDWPLAALIAAFICLNVLAEARGATVGSTSASNSRKPTAVPAVTSAATVAPVDPTKKKSWSAELASTYSSSIQQSSSPDYHSALSVTGLFGVRLSDVITSDISTEWSKDLTGLREAKLGRTVLGVARKPMELGSAKFKYRPKLSFSLPTDEMDRKLTSYRGGIGFSNRIIADLHPDWTIYYQLGLTKSFFEYTTTGKGQSNNTFTASHRLLINRAIGRFYVETGPMISSRWTYAGTISNGFEIYGETGMEIASGLTAGVGVSNSANLYKANGQDSNFSVIDGDTTEAYVMMNWSF